MTRLFPKLRANSIVTHDLSVETVEEFHRKLSSRKGVYCRIVEKPISGKHRGLCSLHLPIQGTNRSSLHFQFVDQANGKMAILAHSEPDATHAFVKHGKALVWGKGVDESDGADRARSLWAKLMPSYSLPRLHLCPSCRALPFTDVLRVA